MTSVLWLSDCAPRASFRLARPRIMGTPAETDPHAEAAALLQRVADGDPLALESLYDRHAGTLLGVILSVLHNREESEDVLQDLFVTIWNRAHQYDPDLGKALTWMIAVARNRAYDRARSLGRKAALRERRQHDLNERTSEHLRKQWNPLLGIEEARRIESALDVLPSDQREAIELAYFEGFTQQEIAARLDTPLGTIKARIRRGLLKLREHLGQCGPLPSDQQPPPPATP